MRGETNMANVKETDLYQPVKEWLEDRGYEVYPEVQHGANRADVVGIKADHTVIVELKTSLSLELIAQGVEWIMKKAADQVYIAVPMPHKDLLWYTKKIIAQEGLGLLVVAFEQFHFRREKVRQWSDPKDIDVYANDIRKAITDLHGKQDIEGGHNGGGYLTGYKVTITRIKEFLEGKRKWVSLDDIVANCPTHYSGNVRQSIAKALKEFERSWCEHSIIDRKLHFRCKQEVKK